MSPSDNLYEILRSARRRSTKSRSRPRGRADLLWRVFAAAGRMAPRARRLGVEPGDRVAAQIDKSPEAIMLALACFRAGAALLPLNTAYTLTELEYFLTDAGPALTLCRPAHSRRCVDSPRATGCRAVESFGAEGEADFFDRVAAAREELPAVRRAKDDLAAILYTSGTTGRSKGAMLTHENLTSNAEALVDLWRFTADDVLIHALPVFHTHGLFVATNVALFAGATMLFQPRFDADSSSPRCRARPR